MWDYAPWEEIVEDGDEFDIIADEFVHETINFFAASMMDKVIVSNKDIKKVKQFILNELSNNTSQED